MKFQTYIKAVSAKQAGDGHIETLVTLRFTTEDLPRLATLVNKVINIDMEQAQMEFGKAAPLTQEKTKKEKAHDGKTA